MSHVREVLFSMLVFVLVLISKRVNAVLFFSLSFVVFTSFSLACSSSCFGTILYLTIVKMELLPLAPLERSIQFGKTSIKVPTMHSESINPQRHLH